MQCVLCMMHNASYIKSCAWCIIYCVYMMHHALCIMHECIMLHVSCIMHYMWCVMHSASCLDMYDALCNIHDAGWFLVWLFDTMVLFCLCITSRRLLCTLCVSAYVSSGIRKRGTIGSWAMCSHWSVSYTQSDAADDTPCVDLGGRRIIKKKNKNTHLKSSYLNTLCHTHQIDTTLTSKFPTTTSTLT